MRSRARAAILLALWAILPGPSAEAAVCAVTTPVGSGAEEILGLAVQSDGKIVAVGYSLQGPNEDFAVVRYNPDLTLDTSFQGTGKVVTPIGTGNDRAEAVAIQSDGKIVVVGYAFMGANNDLAIARYNPNGSLDLGFDGDGKSTVAIGAAHDELFDVAIQPDGNIVAVGRAGFGDYEFVAVRFTSNGPLDGTFAGAGILVFNIGPFNEALNAVALQPDGKIILAGTEFAPGDNDVVVARLNPGGTFDGSFASGFGYVTNTPAPNDTAKDVAVQSDGKIVIAGDSVVTGDGDVAVTRLNANGTGDTTFNGGLGYVRTHIGTLNDLGEALAIQNDGKILVAGTGAGSDMYVVRYDTTGVPDSTFDADGIATVGLVGSTSTYAVGIGSSGSVYVAGGTVGGALNYDFAVGRFNSNGSSPCTEFYLHPNALGSMNSFQTVGGACPLGRWDCVNDQAANAPTGVPALTDNSASYLQDATGANREMFSLLNGTLPPGAIVNRLDVTAQVGRPGGIPSYNLSYQRMGFDASFVDGPNSTAGTICCASLVSWVVSGIAWPGAELDALQIGIKHNTGATIQVSQLYVKVTYMLPPPVVNYRSIGTTPDYTVGTVTANFNSPVVTGLGTSWRSSKRGRGDRIQIDGSDYAILDADSETQLKLASPFLGASGPGKPHTISRQFFSPADWENCIGGGFCGFFPVSSASLVSDNRREVGVVYDDGAPYNTQLVIDGTVTDAIHDIVLTVNPADRHLGRASTGVVFDRLTGSGPVVYVLDDFVTVEWLEIRNGANEGIYVTGQGPVNRIVLRNNLVHNVPTTGILNSSISVLEIYNNVVYNMGATGIELGPSSSAQVYNNTVYNGSGNGISGGTSPRIRNNIAHSFTGSDFSFGAVHPSSSHNLSEDTTASPASPGGGARPNVLLSSMDFVSTTPGSEDLHILNTSAAKDVGVVLSLFDNDIDDGPRPALWDIGADEFGATGGPAVNYFSIGTNPGILASGSATAASGSTTVTFGASLPANVGVGDQLTLDPGGVSDEVLYILSRTSATEVEVQAPAAFAHPSHFFQIRRAFNSLPAWESAREGDLVAGNRREVGVAYNDGPFPMGVTIVDSTTDAAHYMTLLVAPGERHTGVAGTGAGIDGGNSTIGEVVIADDYTVVEGLEITRVRGASSAGVKVQAPGVLLGQLLVYDSTAGAKVTGGGGSSFTIQNSILYRNDRDGIAGNLPSDAVTVLNCTIFGNGEQGVDGLSTYFDVRNTIAMSNTGGDFVFGTGPQNNNMSSDATAIPYSFMIPAGEFVSTTPFAEDLHLKTGAVAFENGIDLSSLFSGDIDGDLRPLGSFWDIGADEFGGGGGGGPAPVLSSGSSQGFTVGGATMPAALVTITEDPATPSITAANDLRIRIPLGFPMRFDSAQTTLFISGPASFKVASLVKAYEDSDRTVVLDVLTDFGPSDQITVDFLRFWSFTAPASADNLELEAGNDDVVSATDDKTITIFPDTFATLSSDNHQVFTQFQPPAAALPFTVSEGLGTSIVPGTDIRIRIPAGFNMTWDTGGTVSFSGPAASKVSLSVAYEDSFRTLRIPVTTSFLSGDYVTVSGARFQGFVGISSVNNLTLDVGASTDFDDKTIEITAASDVLFFTATAKDQAVRLEWFQPPSGLCDNVLLLRRDDGVEPTGPFDPMALQVDFRPCTLNVKDYVDDPFPLGNGTLYTYAAFVEYSGGTYTNGAFVKARPMDTAGTPVQWAYSTGATAMAPPGLRFGGGASYVYAVSNDSILHSMSGGSGYWPAGWKPYKLGGPAQARPPVVSFPVGSAASGAAFLGSQDGNVYAIDALDGSEEWKRSISVGVQAAPAGNFLAFYPGASNIVIAGTRDPSAGNELVALDVHTGNPVWSFDNSPPQLGDGKEIGIISGSASIDYPMKWAFFASHTRGGVNGSDGTLWCVDFSSGSPMLRWKLALTDIEGSPVLWNSTVYVGTVSGRLYAVDRYAAIGTVNWFDSIGNGQIKGFPFPQAGSNRVLVSTMGKVTSFEDLGLTYNIMWQLTTSDIPGPSTPVIVPGTGKVLVGSSDGHLYQFDAFTPLPTTRVQLGDGSSAVGVPTVDVLNSRIYVGSDEGVIYGVTFPLP